VHGTMRSASGIEQSPPEHNLKPCRCGLPPDPAAFCCHRPATMTRESLSPVRAGRYPRPCPGAPSGRCLPALSRPLNAAAHRAAYPLLSAGHALKGGYCSCFCVQGRPPGPSLFSAGPFSVRPLSVRPIICQAILCQAHHLPGPSSVRARKISSRSGSSVLTSPTAMPA